MTLSAPVESIAKALDGREAGNGYLCRCPVPTHGKGHGDRNPSLSIRAGEDGKLLVHCHAGCDPRDVLQALGHYEGQAVAPSKTSRFFSPSTDLRRAANGDAHSTEPKPFSDAHLIRDGYRFVCSYPYATPDGETLYEVCRYEHPTNHKEFLQRRPNGLGGWWSGAGNRKVVYRWPDLRNVAHNTVFVCEGEKDADRLAGHNFLAVTVASGAWSEEAIMALAGYECLILEDNDAPGRKKALKAAEALHGVADSVRIVLIPGLGEGEDVSAWLDHGGDYNRLLPMGAEAPEWQPPSDKPEGDGQVRFPLLPFDQLKPGTARNYLIKGVLPRVGLGVAWGPPKCGKSFWFFDLLLHVALGWKYRDKLVQQGVVIYCAFEGAEGFKARAEAFRRKHKLAEDQGVPLYIMPMRMDLVRDHQALIAAIREQLLDGVHVAAVGLDTLNRSLTGSESSDEDMSAYVNAADAIREAFTCFVGIVHHCGIDGSRPRGHTSLTGAVDAQIAVKRDASDRVIVTVEYMKDGPEGEMFASVLETVEVGIDDDGDAITSCVIVPTDTPPEAGTKKASLPSAAGIALGLLDRALVDAGERPPASNHIPSSVKSVVRVDLWRGYCDAGTVSNSDKPDSKLRAFNRAVEKLLSLKLIGVWNDYVWTVSGQAGQVRSRA